MGLGELEPVIGRAGKGLAADVGSLARHLRRKRAAAEARDEQTRTAVVALLREFASEVERIRSHATAALAFIQLGQHERAASAVHQVALAGEHMYLASAAQTDTSAWPLARPLLEEIGANHVDVLYLRELRHHFGGRALAVKEYVPDSAPRLAESMREIRETGDRLLAALGAAAQAISGRDSSLVGLPLGDESP